jgi:3-oxoacyl-[acyl-carrier-protein] synthase II
MVSSVKSQAGHMLGAAGASSVATGSVAMSEKFIPATINLDEPGEDCDLDYVPNTPRDRSVDFVLVNSFGFGGHNSAVVLRKFD